MRVLLADDHVWLRSALRVMLEQEANFDVVGEAGSAREVPQCIDSLRPDLLFLDWQLPGLETNSARQLFVATVRAINPDLFIIALINDDNATHTLLLGADAFVNRSEPPERILTVLRRATDRQLAQRIKF